MPFAPSIAITRTEEATGTRFCVTCNALVPLEEFSSNVRRFRCIQHHKAERRRIVTATAEKRAVNSLRSKSHIDMKTLFDLSYMKMGVKEIHALLSPDQLECFSKFCIIPRRPNEHLSLDNAIAVTSEQRKSIVRVWKSKHDVKAYIDAVENLDTASVAS
jgi:hypothetical protein